MSVADAPRAAGLVNPLPPGWTQHRAPTGQTYWYHSFTGMSSWTPPYHSQPVLQPWAGPPQPFNSEVVQHRKPEKEKPVERAKIKGTEWQLITTNRGNQFYYHKKSKTSFWEMPQELQDAIRDLEEENSKKRKLDDVEDEATESKQPHSQEDATEFTEDDVMWQLQAMQEEEQATEDVDSPGAAEHYDQEDNSRAGSEPIDDIHDDEEIPDEQAVEAFTELLSESDISPFATWEMELPKFIADSRYKAIKSLSRKKVLFDNFCRVLVQQRKNKQKSESITKHTPTPEEEYMAMLDREVTHHMYWSDFKYKYKRDPAFTAVLDNKKKEKLFKEHIKEIERKKERLTELEDDYMDLLRETREINPRSRWRDIKRILEKDDRYHAIRSSHQREDMFRDYLEDLERDRRRRSRTRSRERR